MIFYHGSFLEIAKPDLVHFRSNVDFGCGFYVTPLYEQAAKWCGKFKRRGKDGIISRYEYDESRESELKTLKFDSSSLESGGRPFPLSISSIILSLLNTSKPSFS